MCFCSVGGLLNATCGNATELIIAILALTQHKVDVVKYSLLGSILSNLLLVLGTSLFCGGIANLSKEQKYDRVRTIYFFVIFSYLKNIFTHRTLKTCSFTKCSLFRLSPSLLISVWIKRLTYMYNNFLILLALCN